MPRVGSGAGLVEQSVGNTASGATDSGNPVKVGGVYNTVAPTLTNGQRGDAQVDVNSNFKVTEATKAAGEDLSNDVMKVEERFSPSNVTTNTTTTIKSGAGFLHSIVVNTTAAGTISIFDNTAGSGTSLGILKASIAEGTYLFDAIFNVGLTIVTAAASNVTATYR